MLAPHASPRSGLPPRRTVGRLRQAARRFSFIRGFQSSISRNGPTSPFASVSQVLVYNGELYNYVELRRQLEAAGQRFQTESDTEVLLRTLVQFGPDGLDRCEGMWAFAVLNEADGSLLLCRDRFGEKPLYLYRDGTGLFFGSEIKFLAALPWPALRRQ